MPFLPPFSFLGVVPLFQGRLPLMHLLLLGCTDVSDRSMDKVYEIDKTHELMTKKEKTI